MLKEEASAKPFYAIVLLLSLLLPFGLSAQQATTWVSDETIASVVRIGKIYDVYLVSGMPPEHRVTVSYGQPDFGGGEVLKKDRQFMDIGSGVVVTENGWLVSNAHVADDWTAESFSLQPVQDRNGNQLTSVAIPANPGFVWVSMATLEDIRANVRRIEVRYLARTWYIDWDYWKYDRDRAICKIAAHARMNSATKLPEESPRVFLVVKRQRVWYSKVIAFRALPIGKCSSKIATIYNGLGRPRYRLYMACTGIGWAILFAGCFDQNGTAGRIAPDACYRLISERVVVNAPARGLGGAVVFSPGNAFCFSEIVRRNPQYPISTFLY